MFNKQYVIMAGLSAGLMMFTSQAAGQQNKAGRLCEYDLTPGGIESPLSRAIVRILGDVLRIRISGAQPDSLYTVWVDFRNRARLAQTGDSFAALSEDYKPLVVEGALERGVAPAFASTTGATSGVTVDANGFITNDRGELQFKSVLDYNLLQPGESPVVSAQLVMQAGSRVGGYWLRTYDPLTGLQQTEPGSRTRPLLRRATAQGITIVRHADYITHGHTPGIGGLDHFPAFKGDFPGDCLP
ncbi:MAG: hypothetical protein ACE5MG_09110, partial [Candidatus Methylomirabilales bacterium]